MASKEKMLFVGIVPSENAELGRIQPALEVIVGIATTEVKGVADTKGNFASDVVEKFGRVEHGKGVKTNWLEEGLTVDVFCVVHAGFSIRDVAVEIQRKVRQSIFHMTSLEALEVNVHMTRIEFHMKTV